MRWQDGRAAAGASSPECASARQQDRVWKTSNRVWPHSGISPGRRLQLRLIRGVLHHQLRGGRGDRCGGGSGCGARGRGRGDSVTTTPPGATWRRCRSTAPDTKPPAPAAQAARLRIQCAERRPAPTSAQGAHGPKPISTGSRVRLALSAGGCTTSVGVISKTGVRSGR